MNPLDAHLIRPPDTAVILGSGLGSIDLGPPDAEVSYSEIPGFPASRVPGHPGKVSVIGPLLVFRGRVHLYEGRSMDEVTFAVRAAAEAGARTLFVTNAAGGLHPSFRPGDLMAITDHLNLMGATPLRGPRFVGMARAYDPDLLKRLATVAKKAKIRLKRGVYAAVAGPSYETPAEARMIRKLGADAVGMSTVPEVIEAVASGLKVLGLSVITNQAGGKGSSHGEVLEATKGAAGRVERLLRGMLIPAGKRR